MARFLVRGYSLVPAPPPRITPNTVFCISVLFIMSAESSITSPAYAPKDSSTLTAFLAVGWPLLPEFSPPGPACALQKT